MRLVIAALVIGGMANCSARRLEVTTDITHFLPTGSDLRMTQLSRERPDAH